MLLHVRDMLWSRDGDTIARAIKSRDPRALVIASPILGSVRVVAKLDAKRTLEAFAEAGFVATPEWELVA